MSNLGPFFNELLHFSDNFYNQHPILSILYKVEISINFYLIWETNTDNKREKYQNNSLNELRKQFFSKRVHNCQVSFNSLHMNYKKLWNEVLNICTISFIKSSKVPSRRINIQTDIFIHFSNLQILCARKTLNVRNEKAAALTNVCNMCVVIIREKI